MTRKISKSSLDLELFNCYSHNKVIKFSYYEKGVINDYSGFIEKIDVLNKMLIIIPQRKFHIDNIIEIKKY